MVNILEIPPVSIRRDEPELVAQSAPWRELAIIGRDGALRRPHRGRDSGAGAFPTGHPERKRRTSQALCDHTSDIARRRLNRRDPSPSALAPATAGGQDNTRGVDAPSPGIVPEAFVVILAA